MIFSLAIYDKSLRGPDRGRDIAGTGTIDITATSVRSAASSRRSPARTTIGARVFLVPAANCAEAAGSPLADDVELVRVVDARRRDRRPEGPQRGRHLDDPAMCVMTARSGADDGTA